MRRSGKRSKKSQERPQIVRKTEEKVLNLIPQENKIISRNVNQLWRWDDLSDVVFK